MEPKQVDVQCRAEFQEVKFVVRWEAGRDLLSDGWHQVSVAVAQSRHRSLLFLLIQHFELVLGQGLAWLWHHFNHIQEQNLDTRIKSTCSLLIFIISYKKKSWCGGIAVCCSLGPCRWPPPPASGRSLLRRSPSAPTRSPDSSALRSSYRSHVPTPPGRSLW